MELQSETAFNRRQTKKSGCARTSCFWHVAQSPAMSCQIGFRPSESSGGAGLDPGNACLAVGAPMTNTRGQQTLGQ
jgi:hypothetical protein